MKRAVWEMAELAGDSARFSLEKSFLDIAMKSLSYTHSGREIQTTPGRICPREVEREFSVWIP